MATRPFSRRTLFSFAFASIVFKNQAKLLKFSSKLIIFGNIFSSNTDFLAYHGFYNRNSRRDFRFRSWHICFTNLFCNLWTSHKTIIRCFIGFNHDFRRRFYSPAIILFGKNTRLDRLARTATLDVNDLNPIPSYYLALKLERF